MSLSSGLTEVIPTICSYWRGCARDEVSLDPDGQCCPDKDGQWQACCCLLRGTLASVTPVEYVAWTNGQICCDDHVQHNAYIINNLIDVSCTTDVRLGASGDLFEDSTFRTIVIVFSSVLGVFVTIGGVIALR
eukprot:852797-Pleurochrysis_carterae.AAC.1